MISNVAAPGILADVLGDVASWVGVYDAQVRGRQEELWAEDANYLLSKAVQMPEGRQRDELMIRAAAVLASAVTQRRSGFYAAADGIGYARFRDLARRAAGPPILRDPLPARQETMDRVLGILDTEMPERAPVPRETQCDLTGHHASHGHTVDGVSLTCPGVDHE
jgi:hypothetical protein